MVRVRIRSGDGRVVVVVTEPTADLHTAWSMTLDEAREMSNGLGAAILNATTAEAAI